MATYEVHLALELPFWLALPQGAYQVAREVIIRDQVNLSNTVERLNVDDTQLGGIVGRQWVERNQADSVYQDLSNRYPRASITRNSCKTILTHVRRFEDAELQEVRTHVNESRDRWYRETLTVVNRMIDAYMVVHSEVPGSVGSISSWDIRSVIYSLWELAVPEPVQVGGIEVYVGPELAEPTAPMSNDRLAIFREALVTNAPLPIVDVLFAGSGSQITRGRFRNAVIDAVSAFELEVANQIEQSLSGRLPAEMVEKIVDMRFDDLSRWLVLLGGPDLRQHTRWVEAHRARSIRHAVVHDGAPATEADARFVHEVVGFMLRALRGQA